MYKIYTLKIINITERLRNTKSTENATLLLDWRTHSIDKF